MKLGVLTNPHYPQTLELAERIGAAITDRGAELVCNAAERQESDTFPAGDIDVLITLGGDGTMLHATHLVAARGTPILGIHMGRLGFLAEVRRDEWEQGLDRILASDYWLEERSMLRCRLRRDSATTGPWDALNEVVIGRSGISRMVRLATYVNQGYFTTYVADGLIVATATGSTAYALSAGGPILPPELRNMLLVPICPHLSLERTVVLEEGATVSVRVESAGDGMIAIDGSHQASLRVGDEVELTTSPHVSRFVRLYDRRRVYETLMERLRPRKVQKPYE